MTEAKPDLVLTFGHDELVIRRRYEVLSIVNDILIAVWFIAGSILFFSGDLATAGTWLFLIGSVELLIRPVIRLTRAVHLQRIRRDRAQRLFLHDFPDGWRVTGAGMQSAQ